MTTPTPPADAPTPERIRKAMETVDELNDSSDACLLAATVVSEWELENKVRRLESELAAKDARIAALLEDKARLTGVLEFFQQYDGDQNSIIAEAVRDIDAAEGADITLVIESAISRVAGPLRAQLQAATERAEKAEREIENVTANYDEVCAQLKEYRDAVPFQVERDFKQRDTITALDRLSADQRRLDWLDAKKSYLLDYLADRDGGAWICTDGDNSHQANTAREAIDSAMREGGKE